MIFLFNMIIVTIIFLHNIEEFPILYQVNENFLNKSNHTTLIDKFNYKNSKNYYDYFKTFNRSSIETILAPLNHCDMKMNNNNNNDNNDNLTHIIIFIKSRINKFELRRENLTHWFNSTIQSKLLLEHKQYNDIIQFNFIENYYNLTRKLIGTIEYATLHCLNTKFILIIDEDFIVNPIHLIKLLLNINHIDYSTYISGYVIKNGIPFREINSKWYISKFIYPFDYYPNYPLGGTIIISRSLINQLNQLLYSIELFPFDDVLIGIVLNKLNISIIHIENILFSKNIIDFRQKFITAHFKGISYLLMNLWKSLRLDKLCYN
ncbi:unnamed protein product [Schistosoma margrebowiei]|uniref:Hexosyltransferase n=1 Tax=Schistosoma margrebowiei TaxID=48269 RepID=A0A183N3S9_9TREM|nr:unnamed protein product [Schistosoma margrebowiei]